jgi:hypothetical protein
MKGSLRRIQRRIKVKKKMIVVVVLAGACFLQSSKTSAQAASSQQPATSASKGSQTASEQDIQLLRQDIQSKKKQLIAANLKLTPTEATKFWPLYDQYSAEYAKIGDEKYAIIKEYAQNWGSVTDEQAQSLLLRLLGTDEAVVQLRMKYAPIFRQALTGKETATFFQLDRRISMLIDLQLASQIPLVQEQM